MVTGMKSPLIECRTCHTLLPKDQFYERMKVCKTCKRRQGREYYWNNRERCRELNRRWRARQKKKDRKVASIATALQKRVASPKPKFTENERMTLCLRLGLNHGRPRTLQEIANELGVSRQRVLQLEQSAIRKLEAVISELRGKEGRRRGMLTGRGRKAMVVLWPNQLERLQRQTNGMQRKFSSTVRHVLDIGFAVQDLYSGKAFSLLSLE